MNISCTTNELKKAIQTASRAIISKPSTPIFAGLHIFTKDNQIEIQGMDINMAISCTIDAEITEPGEIIVSSKHFTELISKIAAPQVTISKNAEQNTIRITAGKSEYQLLLMNTDVYPKFPTVEASQTLTISDEKIKELIKKTIFSCSTDEGRPLFTGILIEVKDGIITFVGTNTHRLAIKSAELANNQDLSIIIPSKMLGEIMRNLNNDIPQDVQFAVEKNQILINIDGTVIVSRLIEGKFPDYHRVIPPRFAITAKVNVKELQGAVERVALFSNATEYNIVKMKFTQNELILSSSSPDVGNGKEVIACETTGDDLNVAFNAKYITDILKNIEAEEAIFSMNTSLSPVCITSPEEEKYTYIVTPVRVVF